MELSVEKHDGKNFIKLGDHFEFNDHQAFRDSYKDLKTGESVIIDFRHLSYMDSSGLGMLMAMRKSLGGNGSHIQFINCNEFVLKIFYMVNFEKLFVIPASV